MPRTVVFIPEIVHHEHHHPHHQHGDYDGYDHAPHEGGGNGHEGRFVGEEGGLLVSGKTAEEVHARLDALKTFQH